jgi:opacity protein-like surface antigen
MKKLLFIILGMVLAYGLTAQVRYGVKIGGTLSSLYGEYDGESDNSDPKIGIKAGAFLEYSFSPSLALQPELLYVNNGGKDKYEDEYESATEKINLHQLQLPVNLKYKMGADNLKFYVAAGPYLGYIIAARLKWSDEDESENLYGEDSNLSHFDFGVGAGVGVEISNKYIIGADYKYGISNLIKEGDATFKTRTFNLSVGYLF